MELFVKGFSHFNLKDNEIYLLDDFNIDLLQNINYIGGSTLVGQRPMKPLSLVHPFFRH